MKKDIKLSEPFFFGREKINIGKCFSDKWISASGKFNFIFENKIKKLINAKYAISCINCTSALQLSVRILNPNPGDEIIVPSITFISTVNAVIYNNCSPIFLDCKSDYLIDEENVINFLKNETFIKKGYCYNKKTKKRIISIIVVHTFGNLVNLNKKFLDECKKRNVKIIEDAAESLGSYYLTNKEKKFPGTIGDIGCLSFNGNKIVTSGGGGMIITNRNTYAQRANYLSNQAKDNPNYFIHNDVGYNFRMSNLHAAVGVSQLKNLKKIIIKKKRINSLYSKYLNKVKDLNILKAPNYCKSNYWLTILVIKKGKKTNFIKDKLIKYLKKKDIEVRSIWFPNHLQKPFVEYQKIKIINAEKIFNQGLCLPSSYNLTEKQQAYIIKNIVNFFKKND